MKKEEWKPVVDFEGLYEVSNKGRVRSLDRTIKVNGNHDKKLKGKILSTNVMNNYICANLSKKGKGYCKRVHRLVCKAFIPNKNKLPCVNHKNEIKTDNYLENLEWCTHKYNVNYNNLRRRTVGKPVYQYDLKGQLISYFDSTIEASESMPEINSSAITNCVKGRQFTHFGFIWSGIKLSKKEFLMLPKGLNPSRYQRMG